MLAGKSHPHVGLDVLCSAMMCYAMLSPTSTFVAAAGPRRQGERGVPQAGGSAARRVDLSSYGRGVLLGTSWRPPGHLSSYRRRRRGGVRSVRALADPRADARAAGTRPGPRPASPPARRRPAGRAAGDYLLSWRWDCEQTNQIWQNCADVRIGWAASRVLLRFEAVSHADEVRVAGFSSGAALLRSAAIVIRSRQRTKSKDR